jgi:hypothetical protein
MGNCCSSTATVPSCPPHSEAGEATLAQAASLALSQPVVESSTVQRSQTPSFRFSGWSDLYRKATTLHDLAHRGGRPSVVRSAPQQNPRNTDWSRSSLAQLFPKAQSVVAPNSGNRSNPGITSAGESDDVTCTAMDFECLLIQRAPQGESRGSCRAAF